MKYTCLVVDHDDTVVNSTATVHYPCFVEYMRRFHPQYSCSLEHYFLKNFDPGVVAFFRDEVGLTEEEMLHEQTWWNEYVQGHVPPAYPGMKEILWRHVSAGGLLCVVSHSYRQNILRDYRENGLPTPHEVYGWEVPHERRKPEPWSLQQIMTKYRLKSDEILMLDDLKPGYDMARACGVPFAAAGWANDIPSIEQFMRTHCDRYFKTVAEFGEYVEG